MKINSTGLRFMKTVFCNPDSIIIKHRDDETMTSMIRLHRRTCFMITSRHLSDPLIKIFMALI